MTRSTPHFVNMELEPFYFQKRARNKNYPCLNIDGSATQCFVFKANEMYLLEAVKSPNTYLTLLVFNKVQDRQNSKVELPVLFDFTFDFYRINSIARQTMVAVLILNTEQPMTGIEEAIYFCVKIFPELTTSFVLGLKFLERFLGFCAVTPDYGHLHQLREVDRSVIFSYLRTSAN